MSVQGSKAEEKGAIEALRTKRGGTLALLAVLFLLAILSALGVSPRGIGPEVALEGELARRFRAWGSWGSIGAVHLGCRGPKEDTPLGLALLEVRKVLGPFWLRVEGGKLYLAFPERGLPTSPLFSPEAALARWEVRLKEEMRVIEHLLLASEEPRKN